MNSTAQKHCFAVEGMHCRSCVVLTESELQSLPNVVSAKSCLRTCTVEVCGDFGGKAAQEIAGELSEVLIPHGYRLSTDRPKQLVRWRDFAVALPLAVSFILLFIGLQKIGLVNLVSGSNISYGTVFLIGVIASLSTCMAVVGGLVLSLSATFAKGGDRIRPQLFFHGGRLIAFFLLGGVIGALGTVFTLTSAMTMLLNFMLAGVMVILGINLMDIFPSMRRLQPAMPGFLSRHALAISHSNHVLTPILAGVATFFLPCGFTQSMQLYTLSAGSFWSGALTMTIYALGTLPVLAVVSFSSLSIKDGARASVFFKTAGLIVIAFAIFNLINGLAAAGYIKPIFNL